MGFLSSLAAADDLGAAYSPRFAGNYKPKQKMRAEKEGEGEGEGEERNIKEGGTQGPKFGVNGIIFFPTLSCWKVEERKSSFL